MAAAGSLSAQQSPGSFSLPEPTPSPTPAPQGPADERAGVRIAPRVIEPETVDEPTPRPTTNREAAVPQSTPSQSTPSQSTGAEETAGANATPTSGEVSEPSPPPRTEPTSQSGGVGQTPSEPIAWPDADQSDRNQENAGEQGGEDAPVPGFDTLAPAIAPPAAEQLSRPQAERAERGDAQSIGDGVQANAARQRMLIAVIALLLVVAGLLGYGLWRRRRGTEPENAASRLLANVSNAIAEKMPQRLDHGTASGSPGSGAAAAKTGAHGKGQGSGHAASDAGPVRVDLTLDIVTATRSMKTFSIECRIAVVNRSDHAIRDLVVYAQVESAGRRSTTASNGAPRSTARQNPLGTIGRIGPHQSGAMITTLQMPLSEMSSIPQGQQPFFVPLVHVAVDADRGVALSQSFVVGTRSSVNQGRLHPLPLHDLPGGLPGLKAQAIREPVRDRERAVAAPLGDNRNETPGRGETVRTE